MFRRNRKNISQVPTTKTDYPYGVFVVTEAGFYLIRDKCRLKVKSLRVMASWSSSQLISSEDAVKHLPVLGTIGFRDGSLVRNFADGKVYLISKNLKRHIVSPDVFQKFGFNKDLIIDASEDEVNIHEDGEVLS
jgi:hypothetical protein